MLKFTRAMPAPALVAVLLALTAPAMAADPLGECYKSADTAIETQACLKRELDAVKKNYDDVVDRVANHARELDRVQSRKTALKAFTQANKSFERFVDDECGWVSASFGSGSGAGNAELACRINLLRLRAGALDAQFVTRNR